MIERILQEIEILQKQYGELEYDPNGSWVIFKKFKLPHGWSSEHTELMILIQSGYPSIPPDNFFVPIGFKLTNGNQIGNYSEPVTHLNRPWGQFSYHIDGEWNPSTNILEGDNLMSFMLKVIDRLKEAS
jgi:hypothetical protein